MESNCIEIMFDLLVFINAVGNNKMIFIEVISKNREKVNSQVYSLNREKESATEAIYVYGEQPP